MRILYAETTAHAPSSAHFLEALEASAERGEHEFRFLDEANFIKSSRSIAERIADRVAGRPLSGYQQLNRALVDQAATFSPDMILIGKGRWFTPAALEAAKKVSGASLVNWATDDPFNRADNSRELLKSIPLYDLYVCTKKDIMNDVRRAGCANVAYARFGYKPEVHFPEAPATEEERERFACDVMFVGGCDAHRIACFEALVRAMPDVKLWLYGAYWERARALGQCARGFAVGRDYRLAVGGAKIAVNLVRRANRDEHVMRTFEIPACGGFMLTERSSTHEELFQEGSEAGLFATPDELVDKVRSYLPRDEDRARIAAAGHHKITHGHHTYGDRLAEIIETAQTIRGSQKITLRAAQSREIESNGSTLRDGNDESGRRVVCAGQRAEAGVCESRQGGEAGRLGCDRADRIEPVRAGIADAPRACVCVRDTCVARASGLAMDVGRGSNDSIHAVPDAGLRLLLCAAGFSVEEICHRIVQTAGSRALHHARTWILTSRSLLHVCWILWTGEMAIRTNTTSIQLAMA